MEQITACSKAAHGGPQAFSGERHQVVLKKKAAEAAIEEAVQGIHEWMAYLFTRLLFFVSFVDSLGCMCVFMIMF